MAARALSDPEASKQFEDEMKEELGNFTNDSAMMIAYERALESDRPDALFNDPFARFLQGPKGSSLSAQFGSAACSAFGFPDWPEFHLAWTAVRTKFIDEQLAKASEEAVQFVNLGAGLDTRTLRLECMRNIKTAFEVDMAVINSFKTKILKTLDASPLCEKVELVSLDLLDKEASLKTELLAVGFDAQQPAVFLAEGLIQYLGDGRVKFLTDVMDVACRGSVFILQFMNVSELQGAGAAAGGLTEAQIRDQFGSSWHCEFYKFGEDALNFGRYDTSRFPPSAAFSFLVARNCGS